MFPVLYDAAGFVVYRAPSAIVRQRATVAFGLQNPLRLMRLGDDAIELKGGSEFATRKDRRIVRHAPV